MPQVSVVIPLYNKAPYVETTVRSAQTQTFQDLEIIVVDDGSSDGSAGLVERFDDPRLVLIRQQNAGAGAARNRGVAAARGRWIAFLDADDLWRPHKVAQQLQALAEHPEVVWAAGAFVRTTADGRTQSSPAVARSCLAAPGVIRDALALLAPASAIWTSTLMVRRDVLQAMGGFDPALRVGQDREFWVRIALQHPRLVYLQRPLAVKREVAVSLTALSRADGSSTAPERARRWAEIAKTLPPDRSRLLRAVARQTMEFTARRELLAGRPRSAREIARMLPMLELGTPSWPVRLAAGVPAPLLSSLLSICCRFRWWLPRANPGS